jgi:hypothetical protein
MDESQYLADVERVAAWDFCLWPQYNWYSGCSHYMGRRGGDCDVLMCALGVCGWVGGWAD